MSDGEAARAALLEHRGYRPARYFFGMVRPMLDAIPDLPLPASRRRTLFGIAAATI
ncbi:MAG: hypothetical protein V4864_14575 [Pseudomonadota bacterium]